MEEEKKQSLSEKIDELNAKLQPLTKTKKGETKELKLPFRIRMQQKRLAKKNKAAVLLLRENRTAIWKIGQLKDGMVEVDGRQHNASIDFIFLYKNKLPFIILPEWSLDPIGTKDYYDALDSGVLMSPQNIIIRKIEMAEIAKEGKGGRFSGMTWVIIGLGVVALLYFIFGR